MFEIERPKIECKELNDYYGCFVVEPLERGFGTTLGNCLRRVLLSSMPGAAASSVKIDGVLHEFSTIPGVKEDVTEIILNIKELRVRLLGESSSVHVVIDAKGEGKVFAGDIIHDADVEIINPDLHIATLSEGANLYMDIVLEKGKGYVSAEKNKKPNMPIGVIAIDSIFTPITKVNFRVEDTRVGQVTDYDKLTLQVWTDGSIRPEEAVGISSRIMFDHLSLFTNLTEGVQNIEIVGDEEPDGKEKIYDMAIEELDLSVRSYNCLKRAGINTVADLKGKKISVQNGSSAQTILENSAIKDDITISPIATNVEALQQLELGVVDVVFLDEVVADYEIKNSGKDYKKLAEGLEEEQYAIAFRKNDQALRDAVQKTLSEMKADGKLGEISTKWFGSDITIVK
mgnify:CR=1 FL=1